MKQSFALAAFAGVVVAGPHFMHHNQHPHVSKRDKDPKFQNFIAQYNKNVVRESDFQERLGIFLENTQIIENTNRLANASTHPHPLRLKMNYTGDMTRKELEGMMGAMPKSLETQKGSSASQNEGQLVGVNRATSVDLAADGWISPVVNQGSCGSCWAFAATIAFEGTIAKRTNTQVNGSEKVLSKSQLVDCDTEYNMGCQGGWMESAWDYMRIKGSMLESEYKYSPTDGSCKYDASKVVSNVSSYGRVKGNDNIKARLVNQPLTIAIDAGSREFQLYSSGVLTQAKCGNAINHAVLIVGYTDSRDDDGDDNDDDDGDDNDDGDDDDDDDGDDDDDDTTPVTDVCNVTKWWHTCEEPATRRLQDSAGYDKYWKIQNSWGTGWGDDGFILFEMTDDDTDGVCGMHKYVNYVE